MSEWRTIDSAPKDGTDIIIFVPEQINKFGIDGYTEPSKQAVCSYGYRWSLSNVGGYEYDEDIDLERATHWQPLPPPPESNK